jgi:hypothetical protein
MENVFSRIDKFARAEGCRLFKSEAAFIGGLCYVSLPFKGIVSRTLARTWYGGPKGPRELDLRRVRAGKHDAERLIYTLGDFLGAQFQRDGELTNYHAHSVFALPRTRRKLSAHCFRE